MQYNLIQDKLHELLDFPADLDSNAQNSLLQMVEKVFTDEDNDMIEKIPTKKEYMKHCVHLI